MWYLLTVLTFYLKKTIMNLLLQMTLYVCVKMLYNSGLNQAVWLSDVANKVKINMYKYLCFVKIKNKNEFINQNTHYVLKL